MTTIKELKEWLNRFPENTTVEFAMQESVKGWEYQPYGAVNFVSPDLTDSDTGEGWEFSNVDMPVLKLGESQ